MQPKMAEGQNEKELTEELSTLLERGWQLDEELVGVRKTYHLKTYTKVLRSGSLTVHWTTHHPRGLSAKDTFMAKYCDEVAKTIGTVAEDQAQRCGAGSSQK
ncbi:MAG: hypothetical protein Q9223_003418 [Gallowayella weberi]